MCVFVFLLCVIYVPKPNLNLLAGMDDKLFGKTANVDNYASNLTGSPAPVSESHFARFSFNLEKFDIDSLNNLGSSIIELVQSDDPSSPWASYIIEVYTFIHFFLLISLFSIKPSINKEKNYMQFLMYF